MILMNGLHLLMHAMAATSDAAAHLGEESARTYKVDIMKIQRLSQQLRAVSVLADAVLGVATHIGDGADDDNRGNK